jgi:kinesin family protein 6/9
MIANVWGEKQHIEETISTLRFATRMMCVTVNPEVNIHYDPLALIKKYEREIKELKQELSMYDTLSNRSHVNYEPYTDVQRQELSKAVKKYIESDEEIEIINLRQIKESFSILRGLYKQIENSVEEHRPISKIENHEADSERDPHRKPTLEVERLDGVGDMEGPGFGVGLAPNGGGRRRATSIGRSSQRPTNDKLFTGFTRPIDVPVNPDELPRPNEITIFADDHVFDQTLNSLNQPRRPGGSMSREEEFENFKRTKGAEIARIMTENKSKIVFDKLALLKGKKKQAKEIAEAINGLKIQMDEFKQHLAIKKLDRAENGNILLILETQVIIEEAESEIIKKLKTLKESYKSQYETLKEIRSDIDYTTRTTDACRLKIMSEFENWFESRYGGTNETNAEKDVLDIGEKFDRLAHERMSLEDPDSLPFYNAKKNIERKSQKIVVRKNPVRSLK